MSVSQRLDLKQSQNLVMTPQLQQAIKLLQMSNMELLEFIRGEAEKNPLIDLDSENFEKKTEETAEQNVKGSDAVTSAEALSDIDTSYDNLYGGDYGADRAAEKSEPAYQEEAYGASSIYSNVSSGSGRGGEDEDREIGGVSVQSLREYLSEQLQLATGDPHVRLIGSYLIGSLNDAGYLSESLEETAAFLKVSVDEVQSVLTFCQTFEPVGVFARDLRECLALQLEECGDLTPTFEKILDHLPLIAKCDLPALAKICGVSKDEISEMIVRIRKLSPKPGLQFSDEPIRPVIPDVLIKEKIDGGWTAEINHETLPKVAINKQYKIDLDKAGNPTDKEYIQENFNQAAWLVKSLDQRVKTILRVATEILRQQDGFFANGLSDLRPMNLKIVAEALGLHESTVSRVTAGKYLRCPRGVYEMKFFFMSGVSGEGEDAIASGTVKHLIKQYIDSEKPGDILSDDAIVEMLKAEGVRVARRTVAKYRESVGIPSSVRRRRMKNFM